MDQKKLKILFLSRFVEKVNRGVETYVQELSSRLAKFHHVEVFGGSDADNLNRILDQKWDLIIPTNGRLQSFKASVGRLFGQYTIFISGQAGIGRDDLWNIVACAPDVYIALTDFEKKWAEKWAWHTKVIKIPNGVDLNRFKPKLKKGSQKVISVGALEWYKHHEYTIRAIERLNDVSLLIIGSGPEDQKLRQMGKTLLGESRFEIKEASFAMMPQIYQEGDLFVLPSWDREAFGIAYVEAMATNLAVVAPNDPPRKEIIGSAGILTQVSDPVIYADAIYRALHEDWKDLPRRQAEQFSWDKISNQYLDLLKE